MKQELTNSETRRTRWPTEQIVLHMETVYAETSLKLQTRLRRNGLTGRMSALDAESIIEEIIASLMKDPTFLKLLDWVRTLPTSVHNVRLGHAIHSPTTVLSHLQIADALFANKTFTEIFASLQTQSLQDQVQSILLSDAQVGEGLTGSEVTLSLAEAGLQEIRPSLERIVEVLSQVASITAL